MFAVASFALLRPALRPRPCVMMSVEPDRSPAPQMAAGLQPSADRTGELYRRMEAILRAAEKGPRAAMARAVNSRWFDLEPAALVENVLVAPGRVAYAVRCAGVRVRVRQAAAWRHGTLKGTDETTGLARVRIDNVDGEELVDAAPGRLERLPRVAARDAPRRVAVLLREGALVDAIASSYDRAEYKGSEHRDRGMETRYPF